VTRLVDASASRGRRERQGWNGTGRERETERDREKEGGRCGTVGVRSFGALVLGAQRAYRRRLADRFSRSSRVETTLRSPAFRPLRARTQNYLRTYTRSRILSRRRTQGRPPCVLITVPARRGSGDAAWKENEGPGTWALSAVLNFMGCDLVLVGAAGTPVLPLSLEYLGDYDAEELSASADTERILFSTSNQDFHFCWWNYCKQRGLIFSGTIYRKRSRSLNLVYPYAFQIKISIWLLFVKFLSCSIWKFMNSGM